MKSELDNISSHRENSGLGTWLAVSAFVFFVAWFILGYLLDFDHNGQCLPFFGCENGFFGYDVFIHISSSAMFVFFIVWLGNIRPKFKVVSANFWKSVVVIIALCALIEVGWEIFEFGIDHTRIGILHEDLFRTNQLLQPSNSDTMGDETFNLAGAALAVALLALFKPGALIESRESVES